MESHFKKELSIQISLSGFSFCILQRATSEINYLKRFDFKSKLSPEALLNQLKTKIESQPELTQPFDNILVLFQNELSSFVPEILFEEQTIADYLKFSSKILTTDFISFDKISANNTVNVFVPYMNINNYLFEIYGEFEYRHASSVMLEYILNDNKHADNDAVYINVEPRHFEMIVLKKGRLQLYNTFEYYTKEDFIYYILFVIEQLKLNPESVNTLISGNIVKDDALYQLLYTYIRHLGFYDPKKKFTFSPSQKEDSLHKHTLILNSLYS